MGFFSPRKRQHDKTTLVKLTATVLAVFLVPVFFVVLRRLFPATGHEARHGTTIHCAATDAAVADLPH